MMKTDGKWTWGDTEADSDEVRAEIAAYLVSELENRGLHTVTSPLGGEYGIEVSVSLVQRLDETNGGT